MVSFYAFPVIFIDTVTASRYLLKICSFQKSTIIKRAGVPTPCTPPLFNIAT